MALFNGNANNLECGVDIREVGYYSQDTELISKSLKISRTVNLILDLQLVLFMLNALYAKARVF